MERFVGSPPWILVDRHFDEHYKKKMCATATSASDEPCALCIVRDLSSNTDKQTHPININLPASTTAAKLMLEVGNKFSYDCNSFELIFQQTNSIVNIHECYSETLEELGFYCKNVKSPSVSQKNYLIICDKKNMPPKEKVEAQLQFEKQATYSNKVDGTITEPLEHLRLAETDVLSTNFKDLLNNQISCDTVLQVKGKKFNAHKAILIARSSVFAAMFQHDTSEKQTGIIDIPDCDSDTFQDFLEYLYSGKLEGISYNTAYHLYKTSDKYDMQELKTFCTKYMMRALTVQNVCDVAILADQYDEMELFSKVQVYFNKNMKEIFVTSEWANLLKVNSRLANKLLIQMSNSKE